MSSDAKARNDSFICSPRTFPCRSEVFKKYWLMNANTVTRKERMVFSIFPSVRASAMVSSGEVDSKDMLKSMEGETGMDRLKMMFSKTEFGNLSPELNFISQTVGLSLFIGSFIGATISSRNAVETTIRKYQSSVFVHQFEAKRHFQDNITLILIKNGFKWAWRLSLFSGMYTTFVTSCAVYNNKASIWEHIAAGALCGSVWKLKLGLRASFIGCGVGGTLGLICGCTASAILWITDTSVEELRYWHHEYWESEYKKRIKMLDEKNKEKLNE